jgi:SAM-dependent methyltransferase
MRLKDVLRPLLPQVVIDRYRAAAAARIDQAFSGQSPAEVFTAVYRNKFWNAQGSSEFCSGTGSHDDSLVKPYGAAVRQFLMDFQRKPDVVDLGCGDFNVGAGIRNLCGSYVACDVVSELIEHNRRTFPHLGVEFIHLDIVSDPLPAGDIAFIRQVLQHLSNEQIAAVVTKLQQYAWVVVTEHLPRTARFTPNRDKPIGPGIRLRLQSGVVLTKPPFNLRPVEQRSLCSAVEASGIIQTTAYRLARAMHGD